MSEQLPQNPITNSDGLILRWLTNATPVLGLISFAGIAYLLGWVKMLAFAYVLKAEWAVYKVSTLDFLLWGADVLIILVFLCGIQFVFYALDRAHQHSPILTVKYALLAKPRGSTIFIVLGSVVAFAFVFVLKYPTTSWLIAFCLLGAASYSLACFYHVWLSTRSDEIVDMEDLKYRKTLMVATGVTFVLLTLSLAVIAGHGEAVSRFQMPRHVATLNDKREYCLMFSSSDRYLVADIDAEKKPTRQYRWVADADVLNIRPNPYNNP